jgi:cadmium resistance protein CadD (predicted permease)
MNQTKTTTEALLELLGWLTLLAAAIGGIFFAAFVTMKVWNWFVPAAFGLTPLAYTQAFGLRLLIWCIYHESDKRATPGLADSTKRVLTHQVALGFVLLFGWMVVA